MKKVIALVLALVMVFALCACGQSAAPAAPAEDADPFVKVGDTVKKGQVVAIVEAMKLMNEIESEVDGVIAEVLVKNGEMVDYGKPLFRVKA